MEGMGAHRAPSVVALAGRVYNGCPDPVAARAVLSTRFSWREWEIKRDSDASLSHARYFSCDMLYVSYVHTHMWKGRAEGLARMARQLEQVHHLSSVMDSEQVANNIYMEHLKSVCICIFDWTTHARTHNMAHTNTHMQRSPRTWRLILLICLGGSGCGVVWVWLWRWGGGVFC
jgi:hypothetical protein